jgi:hypothetical protein
VGVLKGMEETHENEGRKIFITITLYLLLAFAFFSNYWAVESVSSVGAILFIFGVLTLIPLTIIYINQYKVIWAWFWSLPFISLILFNLTFLYGKALDVELRGGLGFFYSLGQIFLRFISTESLLAILIFMIIFLLLLLYKRIKNLNLKKLRNWIHQD